MMNKAGRKTDRMKYLLAIFLSFGFSLAQANNQYGVISCEGSGLSIRMDLGRPDNVCLGSCLRINRESARPYPAIVVDGVVVSDGVGVRVPGRQHGARQGDLEYSYFVPTELSRFSSEVRVLNLSTGATNKINLDCHNDGSGK